MRTPSFFQHLFNAITVNQNLFEFRMDVLKVLIRGWIFLNFAIALIKVMNYIIKRSIDDLLPSFQRLILILTLLIDIFIAFFDLCLQVKFDLIISLQISNFEKELNDLGQIVPARRDLPIQRVNMVLQLLNQLLDSRYFHLRVFISWVQQILEWFLIVVFEQINLLFQDRHVWRIVSLQEFEVRL